MLGSLCVVLFVKNFFCFFVVEIIKLFTLSFPNKTIFFLRPTQLYTCRNCHNSLLVTLNRPDADRRGARIGSVLRAAFMAVR